MLGILRRYRIQHTKPENDRAHVDTMSPASSASLKQWRIPTPASMGLLGRNLLGGWGDKRDSCNLRSGLPYSVVPGIDNSLTGINSDRADLIGDWGSTGCRFEGEKLRQWFNTQAFVAHARGAFGNSARNFP